jgi:VIT1/CCC1 family predicted Fe2+/Mn2+ transporter
MITRDLEKARNAYRQKDQSESVKAHQQNAPEQHQSEQGQYLKSLVYGGLDGIITTFAVVAGVAGASLSAGIVLILGFANLIGDGLSMAIGDYLSTKAENDYNRAEREREAWEVRNYPEGEKKELVEIYTDRGMDPEDARTVTDIIAKNEDAWINIMMVEELGIVEDSSSPLKNALVTFASFSLFGFIPLAAFVVSRIFTLPSSMNFPLATLLTGATLFSLGALKTRFTTQNWCVGGLEMLVVGGLASGAAYVIGLALGSLA